MTRLAIVTGGMSGIGRATAELLRSEGVEVAVLDVTGDRPVDVSDADAVNEAVRSVRQEMGPVQILVNAAGIAAGGRLDDDSYTSQWDRALAVNLTGTMNVVRACLADLVSSGEGRIVNIASIEGLGAGRYLGPYSVSKHGVVGFTRSLAVDFGRSGMTANCICPGATLTGMTRGIPEADRDTFARRHVPLGRYGRPEEVAYVVVALTRPEASFINGAVIPVDGGQTATSN